MKYNKKPQIICIIIAAVWLVVGLLLIFVPKFINNNGEAPVAITENICLVRTQSGQYPYTLAGKIKNVSDNEITIKGDGGLKVYFDDSENTYTSDLWYEDNRDIVLQPDEEYDFSNCDYAFTYNFEINRVVVNVDGKSYALIGTVTSQTFIFGVLCLFVAVILLVIGLCTLPAQKRQAMREAAVNSLSYQFGENCTVLVGVLANKSEQKSEAAKTALWGLGALLSAIFLGAGVFHIYRGAQRREFILSDDALYILDPASPDVSVNIKKATKAEFTVANITAKKNKVIMTGADGNITFTFLTKKCPLSNEQLTAKLNEIFVIGVNPPVQEEESAPAPVEDVFTEFASTPVADGGEKIKDDVAATDAGNTDGQN